jgi:hypothetical protein
MTCDHDATKSSLRVFLAATYRHAFQEMPDGEEVLIGNCRGCHSTLAVEVDLARGRVVRGELTTGAICAICPEPLPSGDALPFGDGRAHAACVMRQQLEVSDA